MPKIQFEYEVNKYPMTSRNRKEATMKDQIVLLEVFQNGKKEAELDITHYNADELGLLLDIQEDMGRTWGYKTTNKQQMKERRESHE